MECKFSKTVCSLIFRKAMPIYIRYCARRKRPYDSTKMQLLFFTIFALLAEFSSAAFSADYKGDLDADMIKTGIPMKWIIIIIIIVATIIVVGACCFCSKCKSTKTKPVRSSVHPIQSQRSPYYIYPIPTNNHSLYPPPWAPDNFAPSAPTSEYNYSHPGQNQFYPPSAPDILAPSAPPQELNFPHPSAPYFPDSPYPVPYRSYA